MIKKMEQLLCKEFLPYNTKTWRVFQWTWVGGDFKTDQNKVLLYTVHSYKLWNLLSQQVLGKGTKFKVWVCFKMQIASTGVGWYLAASQQAWRKTLTLSTLAVLGGGQKPSLYFWRKFLIVTNLGEGDFLPVQPLALEKEFSWGSQVPL